MLSAVGGRLLRGTLILLLSAGSAAAQTDVRVLSYNIHRDIGGSDSNVSAQPALARILNYIAPDVWAINELGGNNVTFNATAAHDYLVSFIRDNVTFFGPTPRENVDYFVYLSTINDNFETVAIVSRYPFIDTATYSDGSGSFRPLRGLARASVEVNGGRFDVFTTHLKALNSITDAERRQDEAEVDNANIKNWIGNHPTDAVVVTGDWNETEEPGETTNWTGHHIGDPLPNNGEAYRPISIMRSGLSDPAPVSIAGRIDTISSTTPVARFDYALYSQARFVGGEVFDTKQYSPQQLADLNASHGTSLDAADSARASDHLPVLSVFRAGGAAQLLNISTRVDVLKGNSVAIAGFIITGTTPRKVLIRGIGPSLAAAGISKPLADPVVELYDGSGRAIATNDNWKQTQQQVIEGSGLAPKSNLESAIMVTLPANNSSYTAILRASGDGDGIGVIEVYDVAPGTGSKLANIATRGFVQTGDDIMIGGLIVGPVGGADAKVVVRAIGPSLSNFGIDGPLEDPTLDLINSSGTVLRSSDDWKEGGQDADLVALGLQPSDNREAALIEKVSPGNYTAIVRGKRNTTGVALVEVYNIP
jgi:endonuclease/exonuclease/phosphatase family metal-dependent hydrolase